MNPITRFERTLSSKFSWTATWFAFLGSAGQIVEHGTSVL